MSKLLFGPAGNSKSFYDAGFKSSFEMPKYIVDKDLEWYEYSCSKGANIRKETAEKIGNAAKEVGVGISIHAPYYINLANADPEKRLKSREYIYQTLGVARNMGAKRIVFHPGSYMKQSPKVAFDTTKSELDIVMDEIKNRGFYDIQICPETMGKLSQLGNLDEVLELCSIDEQLIPTIDFGHLNSRSRGLLKTQEDYSNILDTIENKLGVERMKNIHIHFSHQEYSGAGERRHLTFDDDLYGPFFEPLSKELVKRRMSAVVVCESNGTMIEDAAMMKKIFQEDLILADAMI
jgi:deoxyribonuclease-4